ncbi:alpha/beta hydrolase [Salibacterium halotolerans]|uniref:Lysophospholipase, alpha-beta hydrolase superfamily n=1 Tax=Salibacterium halotolerans TaxID=1884432 RepID=A0A1I5RHR3_9BACI|nr:alpha/beta hydrolase [Salibacterium halotolerans]SFP57867.1 Lysophospholipase, alpha-beta hydrolase superfamily [Salibacterium halotolerans]
MDYTLDISSYRDRYNLPFEQVKHIPSYIPFRDYYLFYQLFRQPHDAPVVLFLHGLFDHAGVHGDGIRFLTESGYHVAAFDLPGHGRSGGPKQKEEVFDEYREALSAVLSRLYQEGTKKLHGIGHSTGGAVLADYLLSAGYGEMFQNVVLVSPLIRSNQWHLSKMAVPLVSLLQKELPRKFRMSTGAEAFMKQLKNDPLEGDTIPLSWVHSMFEWERDIMKKRPSQKPISILQGTKDQTLEWKHNLKAYAALFPRSERILIHGARHHLLNEQKAQKQMTYHLIDDRLKRS